MKGLVVTFTFFYCIIYPEAFRGKVIRLEHILTRFVSIDMLMRVGKLYRQQFPSFPSTLTVNMKFNVLLTVHHAMIRGNCPT